MLSILGSKITQPLVLRALAARFNLDNQIFPGSSRGLARPENVRIIISSLGNILCGFTDKVVNSMFESDANLFVDTSTQLGKLQGCSPDVLSTLATHAVRPSNYGPPRMWTPEVLQTVGVVVAGLKPDIISTIPPAAMQGLNPHAVKALSPQSFSALTTDQMTQLSYNAAKAVLPSHVNALSPNQLQALRQVTEVSIPDPEGVSVDDGRPEETRSLGDPESDPTGRAKGRVDTSDAMEEAGISGGTTPSSTTTTSTTSRTTPTPPSQTKTKGAADRLNHSSLLPLLFPVILAMFLV